MKTTKEKIIEVLKKHSIEITFTDEAKSWIIPDDAFNLIATELESLQEDKEVDINTPFFGNSGATIPMKDKPRSAEALPESFKTLFRCLQDGCYEINFYGNDGNDNQEKINGKELLIKWITDAYFDASQDKDVTDEEIKEWASEVVIENEDKLTDIDYMLLAAKAHRDGLIPHKD